MKYPVPKKLEIIKQYVHELLSWLRIDSIKILKGHCYYCSSVCITYTCMKVYRLSAHQEPYIARQAVYVYFCRGHIVVL
jgi:hypothetical protein